MKDKQPPLHLSNQKGSGMSSSEEEDGGTGVSFFTGSQASSRDCKGFDLNQSKHQG